MTIIRPPAAPVWRPPHAAGYLTVLLDYVRRIRNPSDDEEGSREQALKALASGGDDVSPCPYKETCGHYLDDHCSDACAGKGYLTHDKFENALESLGGSEENRVTAMSILRSKWLWFFSLLAAVLLGALLLIQPSKTLHKKGAKANEPPTIQEVLDAKPPTESRTWDELLAQPLKRAFLDSYPFSDCFSETSKRYGVHPALLLALAQFFSDMDPDYDKDSRLGSRVSPGPSPQKPSDLRKRHSCWVIPASVLMPPAAGLRNLRKIVQVT